MPSFGTRSQDNLAQAHPELQRLFNEVIKHFDCSVICGHRSQEEQDKAYHEGKSKLKFPQSKHNGSPSLAVDVIAYPIEWDNYRRNYMFVGFVRGVASQLGINIRCGADWDGDTVIKDQNFHDIPHFELII